MFTRPEKDRALRLTNAHYARKRRRRLAATLRLIGLWWGFVPPRPDARKEVSGA